MIDYFDVNLDRYSETELGDFLVSTFAYFSSFLWTLMFLIAATATINGAYTKSADERSPWHKKDIWNKLLQLLLSFVSYLGHIFFGKSPYYTTEQVSIECRTFAEA